MSTNAIIVIVVVAAIVVVGAFLLVQYDGVVPESEDIDVADESGTSLGEDLFRQAGSENPAAGLPESNPFSEGKTNPLKNTYTNPFE